MRRVFTEAWRKRISGESMDPLEQIITSVIEQHPEYHAMLEKPDDALEKDYTPEGVQANPFLHLSMHLGLQEQISTDRPVGISGLYRQLVLKCGDAHTAEHEIMECLGQMIWESQRYNRMPDERAYIQCIRSAMEK